MFPAGRQTPQKMQRMEATSRGGRWQAEYTKQYHLCSVPYSLTQPLFGFNCPGSIAVNGSGKWGANILAEPTR